MTTHPHTQTSPAYVNTQKHTPPQGQVARKVMILLIAIAVVATSFMTYMSEKVTNILTDVSPSTTSVSDYKTEFRGDIPSSCGYTVGWPTTVDNEKPYRQWKYEEASVGEASFRNLAPADMLANGVLMGIMQYKSENESLDASMKEKGTYTVSYPGFVSYCIGNTKNWDLADFVSYIQGSSNDQLKHTVLGEPEKWGDVEVQNVRVEGILGGGYVNEPFFVGVVPEGSDYSRLVIFQPWTSDDERLEVDAESLKQSLKNRTLTEPLTILQGSSGQQSGSGSTSNNNTPSCVQYQIYEGEFASNKCYTQSDLKELQYYIKRYNSAIFDQNAAARSSEITCTGSDFFKQKCEDDKKRHAQSLIDQQTYKAKVLELIAKGK